MSAANTKNPVIRARSAHIRLVGLGVFLLVLFLLSFIWGRYDVPLTEVLRILAGRVVPLRQTWTDHMAVAVLNVRLPRILMACLVGCSLVGL